MPKAIGQILSENVTANPIKMSNSSSCLPDCGLGARSHDPRDLGRRSSFPSGPEKSRLGKILRAACRQTAIAFEIGEFLMKRRRRRRLGAFSVSISALLRPRGPFRSLHQSCSNNLCIPSTDACKLLSLPKYTLKTRTLF